MGKNLNKREIVIGTCARCGNGKIVPTKDGDPRIAECSVLKKNFVADSRRKCYYARWS